MIVFAEALNSGLFTVGKVCTDCTITLVNGDPTGNDPEWNGEQYEATLKEYHATPGHLHEGEWASDCAHQGERCPDDSDCDCARTEFSWSDCDLCGTTLGGERHDFILIHRELLTT